MSKETSKLMDLIISFLQNEYPTASIKLDGNFFSSADITIQQQSELTTYRIAIIKQEISQ